MNTLTQDQRFQIELNEYARQAIEGHYQFPEGSVHVFTSQVEGTLLVSQIQYQGENYQVVTYPDQTCLTVG